MAVDATTVSESIESYLENILRLGSGDNPVPLSRLAETLGVSPISVNQMCRKLQDQGLVEYVPYKGVSCTPKGRAIAARVLRRHRLWEVFLVDHLQMEWQEAHEAACLLEHNTTDGVAERLDTFLGYPRVNPQGYPIPSGAGAFEPPLLRALAEVEVGQPVYFVRSTGDPATGAFLASQGFRAGAPLQVLAIAPESLLVQVGEQTLALQRAMAATMQVGAVDGWIGSRDEAQPRPAAEAAVQVTLDRLRVGQRGIVVRVSGNPRLRGRLLEMGLVPGETVAVRNLAPLGDPVELVIKGYQLSLRREEAAQVLVEMESPHAEKTTG